MAGLSAVIFLPDDTGKTGLARPLLLQNLMGAPLLSWLVDSLAAGGVERFFLVCRPACEAAARDCFPEGKELVVAEEGKAAALFSDFLAAAGDDQTDVIVVTGPCVLLPYDAEILALPGAPEASNLLCVKKTVLQQALADQADLLPVLEAEAAPYTDRDGAFTIESLAQLTDFQPLLNRAHLYRLAETGVEIWDFGNTYIDPTCSVAPGVTILPGTILRGKTTVAAGCVLGPNTYVEDSTFGAGTIVNSSQVFRAELGEGCHVGPFAYVRAGTKAGNHVKIGDFVEVRSVTLGDNAKVAHLSYVGDSEVGSGAQLGCGAITVNYDREKKYRTVIGENAFIGSNVNLVAPITVGKEAYVAAGSTITEDVPPLSLAIARARQSHKREWAGKFKLKKP